MDKPGSKINLHHPPIKPYVSSAQEQSGHEHEDGPNEPLALLFKQTASSRPLFILARNRNEGFILERLLDACVTLCPFVNGQLHTATTMELAAKYMSYLKQTLPQDVLSEVNKAVQEKMKGSWKKRRKPPKKRTVRPKRNSSQRAKLAAKKSTEARVLRRHIQQKNSDQVNEPCTTVTNPLMMDEACEGLSAVHAPPILLDKWAVPRGQMLPVCQDQFLAASFQSVENNWMKPSSSFLSPTSSPFTSVMISQTLLPETGLDPQELWDATPGMANPVAPPPDNFVQPYSPLHSQTAAMNFITEQSQIHSPPVGRTENISDVINQPLVPSMMFQGATISSDMTSERLDQTMSEAPCNTPWTSSLQDTVSPFWLDWLLDTNNNFPDATLEDSVLSPFTESN